VHVSQFSAAEPAVWAAASLPCHVARTVLSEQLVLAFP